jgi:hypothetical protein
MNVCPLSLLLWRPEAAEQVVHRRRGIGMVVDLIFCCHGMTSSSIVTEGPRLISQNEP